VVALRAGSPGFGAIQAIIGHVHITNTLWRRPCSFTVFWCFIYQCITFLHVLTMGLDCPHLLFERGDWSSATLMGTMHTGNKNEFFLLYLPQSTSTWCLRQPSRLHNCQQWPFPENVNTEMKDVSPEFGVCTCPTSATSMLKSVTHVGLCFIKE